MNPSNPNHHHQPTRLVTAAGHDQYRIEVRTGWAIKKFVRDTRSYRIVKSRPTSKPAPPPTRYPTTSARPPS
jgi:hypothetical protein